MDATEALRNELQKHQIQLIEYQSKLYEVKHTIDEFQTTYADLRDKLAFERGVIQSLEFAASLSESPGQKPEDK